MDQRKAIFRAKLRETKDKQQRRIDPSLVRYNEYDQPICRVCNITLKSEALWPAHQVSRKHHEAKAAAAAKAAAGAGSRGNSARQEQPVEPQKEKSSTLPTNFFDNQGTKRQSDDASSEGRSVRREVSVIQPKTKEASTNKQPVRLDQMAKKGSQTNTNAKGILPGNFFDYEAEDEAPAPAPKELTSTSGNTASSNHMQVKGVPDGFFDNNKNGNGMQPSEPSSFSKEAKSAETAQVKGSLPEGFFDNKDADLRARGIQPQKVVMNDVYKEFEKEIQEDLQEVDDRLEEEEIDAAAEREEYLTLEQQEYRQQVDMLKKQLIESKAARTAKANSKPVGMDMESSSDSSSDEEDDNTDFAVDWRAQHLK
ncbi:protein ABA AND ROS SENSITIVE 1-like [Phragmites australis]|uniref:protein ABA AND ROS SENSITIVE 1-like n=1 Tax=Phragmites australis TaxID=29695 RepID=UPI002D7816E0|nr:protein ABA AND ROS SENSITIVE 1-like [Phragmites australis]